MRKKCFSDGGLVYLTRPINPNNQKNIFRFYIKESKTMDILIGVERVKPKAVWFVRLSTGERCIEDGTKKDFVPDRLMPKGSAVVRMSVERDSVLYWLNGKALGVAYRSKVFTESSPVFPFVFIRNSSDQVIVMKGARVRD